MNDETAREKLAAAYSGCTPEVFADAPKEWRQAWYDDTEALLPVVREIVAEELRETADEDSVSLAGLRVVKTGELRERADALHATEAAS